MKFLDRKLFDREEASLPSRERGLKFSVVAISPGSGQSLPSRERGLKFESGWGESKLAKVAPLAGAWIEMLSEHLLLHTLLSLPSRERGLKYDRNDNIVPDV